MKERRQRRPRRAFTPQDKADAVRMVKAGKSVSQVARELAPANDIEQSFNTGSSNVEAR
ncbi:hypothetical protein AKJ09_02336 [Labilithrix luteola]|uniref:Uncharacterized protein n=1 Tax=Labilithrix luteola TaxID=1391654 RepID=A0A0K1PQ71_9BACT|nr:hypothetical protein AKJ09_02336 [Labilithrix luteola]